MKKHACLRLPLAFLGIILGLNLGAMAPKPQSIDSHEHHHSEHANPEMNISPEHAAALKALREQSDDPEAAEFGSWETVIPKNDGAAVGRILGMQTVHNVLLPSGKLLMSSGSSWRNYKNIQTYPDYDDPAPAMGVFNRYNDPFRKNRIEQYYQVVNNSAIYDPVENSFYRIPHPLPEEDPDQTSHFIGSDLFCSGHIQLADGNALFIGGTQYYFPYRTGTNSTYIFDWRKETEIDWKQFDWRRLPKSDEDEYLWTFSGFMKRGRWYPSIVPMPDGRMVIFSGFVGFDHGFPEMYQFQINPYIEFFDPAKFSVEDPQKAWKAIDVKNMPGSPFTTRIYEEFMPTQCTDLTFLRYFRSMSCDDNFQLPCVCGPECMKDNLYDAFKLYPNNYLFDGKRVFLTREGDWVSLRTADAAYMRRTRNTYWMDIEGTAEHPRVAFSPGPDRPEDVTSYGTSFNDRNSGNVIIFGGQPTSAGTLLPLGSEDPSHFAGGRGSRKMETFIPNPSKPRGGEWTLDPNFLGLNPQDDRTMLTAIILPTRQILIINGGNYDFYGPVFYPLLLTPEFDREGNFIRYTKKRMADAVEPRLYHNAALLLPDGRVWVSGGNSARASVEEGVQPILDQGRTGQPKPDLDLVDLDMYFFNDGQMAKAQKGMLYTPTENWTAEIFTPPYLHIDPKRRARIESLSTLESRPGYTFKSVIGGDTFYLLKSDRTYRVSLGGLPGTEGPRKAELVLIKLPSFTHNWDNGQDFISLPYRASGSDIEFTLPSMKENNTIPGYYMMFYVDSKGKPSKAQMVRLDDKAEAP